MDLLWFSYHPLAIKSLDMLLIQEQVLCGLDNILKEMFFHVYKEVSCGTATHRLTFVHNCCKVKAVVKEEG